MKAGIGSAKQEFLWVDGRRWLTCLLFCFFLFIACPNSCAFAYRLEFLPEASSSGATVYAVAEAGPLMEQQNDATDLFTIDFYDLYADVRVEHYDPDDLMNPVSAAACMWAVAEMDTSTSQHDTHLWRSRMVAGQVAKSSADPRFDGFGHGLYSHSVDLSWEIKADPWDEGVHAWPRMMLRVEDGVERYFRNHEWGESSPHRGTYSVRNCFISIGDASWGPFSWTVSLSSGAVSGDKPPATLEKTAAYGDIVNFRADISCHANLVSYIPGSFYADIWAEFHAFLSLGIAKDYSNFSVTFHDRANPAREVRGAAADGASRVEIRITGLSDDVDVSDIEIIIPEHGGFLESDAKIMNGVFTRTYVAPSTFARPGYPDDWTVSERAVEWHLFIDEVQFSAPPLYLAKPAVVLIHGLWSGPEIWKEFVSRLHAQGYAKVHPVPNHDYRISGSFNENMRVVNDEIRAALSSYQEQYAIVARKADVIAHSMGGVLTKMFGSPVLIRSVVTIGTPHYGSGLADLLCDLWDAPLIGTVFAKAMASFNMPLGGAVRDLAECQRRYSLNVPTLAVVGDVTMEGDPVEPRFADFIMKLLIAFAMMPGDATIDAFHSYVFGPGVGSDWIVPVPSQKGPVSNWASYKEWHGGQHQNEEILNACVQFLQGDLPLSLNVFETETHSGMSATDNLMVRETSQSAGQVEIIRPEEGQTFSRGESVTVEATVSGPDAAQVFFVTSTGEYALVSGAPYLFQFDISGRSTGTLGIQVIAGDSDGFIGAEEVFVNIAGADDDIYELITYPRRQYLRLGVGAVVPLKVSGVTADGAEIDITPGVRGTAYASSDPWVVEVSSDGVMLVNNPGEASVTVSNSGFSWTYLVTACRYPGKGDVNFDGVIDVSDVMLTLRMAVKLPVTIDGLTYEPSEGYPEWCAGMADMDEDGGISILDSFAIYREALDLAP